MVKARIMVWTGLGAAAVMAGVGVGWLLSLPPASASAAAPAISDSDAQAILAALRPPKRTRPLIAVIGINDATETTDYLMPYGILRRADVADIQLVATASGPVKLFPVLTVEPHTTVSAFDTQHPDGADYVIVPAMSRDDDPAAIAWIKNQQSKGATIIGVCAGAKVVAETGLLDGKQATTHWYYLKEMLKKHPGIHYVPNRRVVVDRGVATTTGISASMPVALTLIEAIAGRARAEAVARDIGVRHWDARHDSEAFQFTRPFATTAIRNSAAFWRREEFGMDLSAAGGGDSANSSDSHSDIDEVSLALVADAWSRTYRSHVSTFSRTAAPLRTRNGVSIVPDRVADTWPADRLLAPSGHQLPATALDEALRAIALRYGSHTSDFVAMQLEYPK